MVDTESDPEIIGIVRSPIRVDRLLENVVDLKAGAVSVFLGTVRNTPGHGVPPEEAARRVIRLEYEAYENMALLHFRKIADEARSRWNISRVVIVHRVGALDVGETSVAVLVSAPHREEAISSCRYAIERLKAEAPVWKKEVYADGASRWVANTSLEA